MNAQFKFLMACTLALSGCGKKADASTATQVAAKVGSEEISIHQINQLLGSVNAADTSPEAVELSISV